MSRPVVYVAGPMTGLEWDSANDWREKVRVALPDCEVRSPLRGKAWLQQESVIESSEYPMPFGSKNAIIKRDHWDVQCADLVLANFEDTARVTIRDLLSQHGIKGEGIPGLTDAMLNISQELTSTGTCFEMGWGYEFGTPIIAIIPEHNIHRHAFIEAASLEIVKDLKTALSLARLLLNLPADGHAECC